jgi:MFS family permease
MNPASTPARLSMSQVLLCGAAIVTLSMGIRHGFGLFLQPITMDRGWTRETFAFAMALQNLAWGLAGPVAGMWADRFGAYRVLVVGAVLYALGLVTMGLATSGAWPLPAAPGCCWAWRNRAPPTRWSTASSRARSTRPSGRGRWASRRRPARSASS